MAELELAFRDASGGHPRVILLGGESGLGKTRLLAELERSMDGALTLRGECLEHGDRELPYASLLAALRPLVRTRDPVLAGLSPASRAYLAELLPGLGEPHSASGRGDDEALGQMRLFESLLELLDVLSARAPVALILEDVHWADSSTRAFAGFLAHSLRAERLMVVLTFRSDELRRRHPVRPLLAELDRLECSERIELAPFDRAELTEALGDILGREPEPALVERLLERSEGNPLYVEELLAAGLDGRGAAPQSLRDAFLLRIERLSPAAQAATRAVAVGQRLDETIIAALTGIDGERLHEALREAVAEHVLEARADGQLAFRHALLRETLYDDLLPGERGELHLALARALEQLCLAAPDDEVERVAAVATHYAAAGEQAAALRATVAAALVAERVHAWGEAAEAAERALELWPRVPDQSRAVELDRVDLLVLAGRAHGFGGDRARAAVLLDRALAELDPEREPARAGAVLALLARIQWWLNHGRVALELAERAEALLSRAGASADHLALLSGLARTRVLRGRFRDAIADGEAALAAAVAAGDPRVEGEVLNTLGMARIALGDVAAGEAQLRRAIELAHAHDDLDGIGTAYSNLADLLSLAGRTTEALQVASEGLEATPQRVSRMRDWARLTVSMLAFEAGNWALARAHLNPAPSQLAGVMLIFRELCEAELALGEGEEALAERCLDAVQSLVRTTSEAQWHGAFGSLLAELRRRQGDLIRARAAVGSALDELEVCTDDVMRIARVTAVGLGVEADVALRARDLRDAAAGRDARARARIHVQRLRAAASEGGPVERAWLQVGLAEAARGRGRDDPALWAKAADAWEALARPYPALTARWRQVAALLERGERDAAAGSAATTLEGARSLGAGWLAAELEGLIARGRLARAAAVDPGAPDGAEQEAPFGLTPRELQVLALVAAGATNRQIGASLYMAEKTASVHVSRILSKLGVASRAQAAALAHRQHLA